MALGRKDVTVTRTNGGTDIFRLAGLFGDDNLIRHQGLVWWTGFAHQERIVNHRPPASHPLGQVCVRAAKPWRNATEWSGALSLSSKPPAAPARILFIRFSDSIASGRPGMRRIGIGSGSLVSNTAGSLAGIELSQLGADAGLGPSARLAIPPSYPNSGI